MQKPRKSTYERGYEIGYAQAYADACIRTLVILMQKLELRQSHAMSVLGITPEEFDQYNSLLEAGKKKK